MRNPLCVSLSRPVCRGLGIRSALTLAGARVAAHALGHGGWADPRPNFAFRYRKRSNSAAVTTQWWSWLSSPQISLADGCVGGLPYLSQLIVPALLRQLRYVNTGSSVAPLLIAVCAK